MNDPAGVHVQHSPHHIQRNSPSPANLRGYEHRPSSQVCTRAMPRLVTDYVRVHEPPQDQQTRSRLGLFSQLGRTGRPRVESGCFVICEPVKQAATALPGPDTHAHSRFRSCHEIVTMQAAQQQLQPA